MNGSKAGLRSTTWAVSGFTNTRKARRGCLPSERSILPTTVVMKASRNGKLKKNTVASLGGS